MVRLRTSKPASNTDDNERRQQQQQPQQQPQNAYDKKHPVVTQQHRHVAPARGLPLYEHNPGDDVDSAATKVWLYLQRERQRRERPSASDVAHYGREYLTMYPLKWFELGINVVWVSLLWTVLIGKNIGDGPWLYYHYFTNWMWTLNTIFYTVDLIGYADWTGTLQFYWICIAWWPFFGNVCEVFALVIPLLYINPAILLDTAEEIGWPTALLGERIVHVIPFFRAMLWLLLRQQDVIDVLSHFWWRTTRDKKFFVCYVILVVLLANAMIAAYVLNFNFHRVYGIELSWWWVLVMVEAIYALTIVLPIIFLSPIGSVIRHNAYRRAPLPLLLTATGAQDVAYAQQSAEARVGNVHIPHHKPHRMEEDHREFHERYAAGGGVGDVYTAASPTYVQQNTLVVYIGDLVRVTHPDMEMECHDDEDDDSAAAVQQTRQMDLIYNAIFGQISRFLPQKQPQQLQPLPPPQWHDDVGGYLHV